MCYDSLVVAVLFRLHMLLLVTNNNTASIPRIRTSRYSAIPSIVQWKYSEYHIIIVKLRVILQFRVFEQLL